MLVSLHFFRLQLVNCEVAWCFRVACGLRATLRYVKDPLVQELVVDRCNVTLLFQLFDVAALQLGTKRLLVETQYDWREHFRVYRRFNFNVSNYRLWLWRDVDKLALFLVIHDVCIR